MFSLCVLYLMQFCSVSSAYVQYGTTAKQCGTTLEWICSGDADSIYRDDVVFRDPKNSFQGIKDYKTIFWSLRFHGKLFFKFLYVDVLRIWESPKNPTDAGTILKWASDPDFISPVFELIISSLEGCLSEVFVSGLTGVVQTCWSLFVDPCLLISASRKVTQQCLFVYDGLLQRLEYKIFRFDWLHLLDCKFEECQLVGDAYALRHRLHSISRLAFA